MVSKPSFLNAQVPVSYTHLLSEVKTFLLSVYCTDVLNTHGFQDSDADQTDRSAALYNNTAVEAVSYTHLDVYKRQF